jgi:hypothetical protein
VALAWTAVVLVLAPFAARVEETLDVSSRIQGSESAAVEEALAARFGSPCCSPSSDPCARWFAPARTWLWRTLPSASNSWFFAVPGLNAA